jgi:hypothetical protein
MNKYPRRSSYGIFVRFRRSRLSLRRGIVRLEDALALAEELRASRFHDRGDVFVIKEPEGTLVEALPEGSVSMGVSMGPQAGPNPGPASQAPPAASVVEPTPVQPALPPPATPHVLTVGASPPSPRSRGRSVGDDLATVYRLTFQLEQARRMIARTREAQARFDGAFAAAEKAILFHGVSPPDALRRHHERLGGAHDTASRAVASCEHIAALLEQRLEALWAEATSSRTGLGEGLRDVAPR